MADWNLGLCGCFSNISSSIITYFLPCVTFAHNAEKSDTCGFIPSILCFIFLPGLGSLYIGAKSRANTREKFGIPGSLLGDCCVFGFCPCCSMIQTQSQLDGVSMGESIERV